ncbi:hypothetical protein [Arsenicicoccus dermatophilus]|uniref:hypothetical protein n=1 Tax=Arsenicicoccus dermatophilus TaxID=1076331 RepID=UPI0039170F3F
MTGPDALLTAALAGLGLPARASLERCRPPAPGDWVTSAAVRLARGGPQAAELAGRLAVALDSRPGVTAHARPPGLVTLTVHDEVLAAMATALPGTWAQDACVRGGCAPVVPGPRRRSRDDPAYAAVLAHARLCRPLVPGDEGASIPAYDPVPHQVLVLLADAHRVAARLRGEHRPHHLVDWLAATGSAVVTWTQDADLCRHDPRLVIAARATLASALRAAGLPPSERF